MTILNQRLIEKQGLTDEDVRHLEYLHKIRADLFDLCERIDPDDSLGILDLRTYAALLESLEFDMQRVWKFEQNADFHSWWYRIPHCKCPKMDNSDPIFHGRRIFTNMCKIHGAKTA